MENTIKIFFGKTDYEKSKTFLHVQLRTLIFNIDVSDEHNYSEYIYSKQHQVYDQEITIKVDKSDFKRMGKKTLEITLYRSRYNSN